jgi:hypothetical protein
MFNTWSRCLWELLFGASENPTWEARSKITACTQIPSYGLTLIWVENPVVHPLDEVWPWWAIYHPTTWVVHGTRPMADGVWVHTSLLCFHNYTGLFSQVWGFPCGILYSHFAIIFLPDWEFCCFPTLVENYADKDSQPFSPLRFFWPPRSAVAKWLRILLFSVLWLWLQNFRGV